MGTSGRAKGKAPFCLGESVTLKERGGLSKVCADGKPVQ
jgi:hypothetical protein